MVRLLGELAIVPNMVCAKAYEMHSVSCLAGLLKFSTLYSFVTEQQ